MPRPLTAPLGDEFRCGDGRAAQPASRAASLTTCLRRSSLRWRSRYATGSAFACAAISSMNDSCANVFWRRAGERSGPVKNGERTECDSTRSLLTVPAPPQRPPTQPATYDGTALLLLL